MDVINETTATLDTVVNVTARPIVEIKNPLEVTCLWIIGLVISALCVVLQFVLYVIRPEIRKLDQKILTQLTIARLSNTLFEYLLVNLYSSLDTSGLIFACYQYTDTVLVCWMFVYAKNIYNKLVSVFVLEWNFIKQSLVIWICAIPVGALCPTFMEMKFYTEYYQSYVWVKLLVLLVNLTFFFRILLIVIHKSYKGNVSRNVVDILKTCIISFILVCITSLQALLQVVLTDVMTYFKEGSVFFVLNSFQAVADTIIFLILAKNCVN